MSQTPLPTVSKPGATPYTTTVTITRTNSAGQLYTTTTSIVVFLSPTSKDNTAVIAGAVVGGVGGALVIAVLVWLCWRRRKRSVVFPDDIFQPGESRFSNSAGGGILDEEPEPVTMMGEPSMISPFPNNAATYSTSYDASAASASHARSYSQTSSSRLSGQYQDSQDHLNPMDNRALSPTRALSPAEAKRREAYGPYERAAAGITGATPLMDNYYQSPPASVAGTSTSEPSTFSGASEYSDGSRTGLRAAANPFGTPGRSSEKDRDYFSTPNSRTRPQSDPFLSPDQSSQHLPSGSGSAPDDASFADSRLSDVSEETAGGSRGAGRLGPAFAGATSPRSFGATMETEEGDDEGQPDSGHAQDIMVHRDMGALELPPT